MKQLMTLLGILIFTNSFGQIKLTWENIDVIDETTISVKVFAQNLGSRTTLWNKYGNTYYDGQEELNFHVEYDYIPTGLHITLPPSSITIKTIFGGSISMETPVYYFESTGTESGQRWEIIFHQLPRESGNVIVKILGEKRVVGDMPLAEKARKTKMDKFYSEKETKIYDYEEFYPSDFINIQNELVQAVYEYTSNNNISTASGKVTFTVDKEGNTSFNINLTSKQLNDYLKNKFESTVLKPTSKLGYQVSAIADFDIVYENGKTKIKKENNEIVKSSTELPDKVNDLFKRKTNSSGKFIIKYKILLVNDKLTNNSVIDVKNVTFMSEKLNLIGIGVLIGVPLIIAVIKGGS